MKKIWILVAVAVVALAALGAASLAYAQTQNPPEVPANPPAPRNWGGMMGRGPGMGGMMGGPGMMGGHGPMHEYMLSAFAEALGISVEELQAEFEAGETMWTIAEAQGLSEDEFAEVMRAAHDQAIEQALADGAITEEQAAFMREHHLSMIEGGMGQGSGHCLGGARGGRGMMGRWNGQP